MRRRTFLLATGLAGGVRGAPSSTIAVSDVVDPTVLLAHQLSDALLGPAITAEPVAVSVLREASTAARREFSACQYVPLAGRLSALVVAAEATVADYPDPAAYQLLAESYNVATRALSPDPHPRRSQPSGHLRCPPGSGAPGDARDAALLRRLRRRTGR